MAENYAVTQATPRLLSECFSGTPEITQFSPRSISRERVETVLYSIPGLSSEARDSNHTFLESENGLYTEISFIGINAPENPSFGFRGGSIELIEHILDRLSTDLGPIILFFGSGEEPRLFNNTHAEQPGAGQPATRPVDEPEGGVKPQPEAEGRSR